MGTHGEKKKKNKTPPPSLPPKRKQWGHHTMALPFTLKSIVRQKKKNGNSNI